MAKKYLSWSITATYLKGKRAVTENLTFEFGLDAKLCKTIEKKLSEIGASSEEEFPRAKGIKWAVLEKVGKKE